MQINVNNESIVTDATTVAQLSQFLSLPARGVALAVNKKIVPRTEWESRELEENDNITIIKAAFGG